jgi:DNA helicase HerA-like ATPase
MEEAHVYLTSAKEGESDAPAVRVARRIVKEGRKYGIGAMVISQRPSEVDETILSQCGTFIALRLSNPLDRSRVQGTLPDNLAGLTAMLPVLRTGEAVITGEAARLPTRARISLPPEGRRPKSEDPNVADRWMSGRLPEDYGQVVAAWRAQSPREVKRKVDIPRRPIPPEEA